MVGEKPICWVGSSLEDLRSFPPAAKDEAGYNLHRVQCGEAPSDAKPMPDVGAGTFEIRIDTGDAFRVFYIAKFREAVYVLHAFSKKTRRTSQRDIELGRQRYREALRYHREQESQLKRKQ